MNKAHRIVWSEVQQAFVVVAETVRSRGKSRSSVALRNALAAPAVALRALPAALWVGGLISVFTSAAYATPPAPTQLPTGGQVVAGQASIGQSGAVMHIQQTSNRAAIDWQTFNVGSSAQVNFRQPDSSSVTLNRVQDANPSQIFGRITANGQVFLSNPNGVYFSPTASVDVGGLVATTHRISLTDFMAGDSRFTRDGASGSVLNEGELKAALGGYIALLAPEVRNTGVIVANLGTVALAAGDAYELQFDANNTLSSLRITPSTIQALVDNRSAVLAPGGLIILSALAVNQVQGSVVQNSGTLEASSVSQQGGRIVLEADHITLASGALLDASGSTGGGTVLIGGDWQGSGDMHQATTVAMEAGARIRTDATQQGAGGTVVLWSDITRADSVTTFGGSISAQGGVSGGNGGRVETSGAQLTVQDTARVDTRAQLQDGTSLVGSWLLDPRDFTVGSGKAGTVTAGTPSGDISGATLSTALGTSNVTLLSSQGSTASGAGNININDAVSWSTNRLTLTAANNVNINAVMTASGDSTLTMNANTANGVDGAVGGGLVLVGLGPNGFVGRVDFGGRSGVDILTINSEAYTVISSLGAQGSSTGTDVQGMKGSLATNYALGANIDASATAGWTNTFQPIGRSISPFTGKFNGLGNTISNLTVDASKQGNDRIGLFGHATSALSNVGLVGGSIGVTTTGSNSGALVGWLYGGSVTNSYASGVTVKGSDSVGGLVGYGRNDAALLIVSSQVTGAGSVQGNTQVGGLSGYSRGSRQIATSYTTIPVSGGTSVGGLIGFAYGSYGGFGTTDTVVDSYASGAITGTGNNIGGLVGYIQGGLTRSYASGKVTGGGVNTGGMAGRADVFARFTDSYWNSTQNSVGLGEVPGSGDAEASFAFLGATKGLTESQLQVQSNFIGFNFTSPWSIVSGYNNGYPSLCGYGCTIQAFIRPTAGSSTYGTAPNISYSLVDSTGSALTLSSATVSGTAVYSGAPTATSNAGSYSISYASGLALGGSNASLYSLTPWATPVTWTVNKLALNLTGTKTYDGTANFAAGTLTASNLLFGACASGLAACGLTGSATVGSARVAAGVQTLGLGGMALGGTIATNYTLTGFTGSGSITAATLTPTLGNTSVTKDYDGTTAAPAGFVPTFSFGGLAAGDTAATLTNTGASYNNAHVLAANTITVSGLALAGITGSNSSALSDYVLGATSSGVAASITPKALTSTASIGGTLTKTYDGNTSASGATLSGSVSGAIAGDTLALNTAGQTLAYNSARVLTASSILASGTSTFSINTTGSNSLASDYSFTGPTIASVAGTISAKALTSVASIGGTLTKAYDGNTSASGATVSGSVSGAIAGDTLALNTAGQTLAYNDAHVLAASSIVASGTSAFAISTTGSNSQASDYSFTGPTIAAATASITAKALTSSAAIGGTLTKTYDGNTSASGATLSGTVSGAIAGDTLVLNTSGQALAYNDAHVLAAGSIVASGTSSFGISATGSASLASDYSFTGPTIAAATASITPKALTSTASIGGTLTKIYDGNNSASGATLSGSVSGGIAGDTLALNTAGQTLAYNSARVLTASSILASGTSTFSISNTGSGSLASDYSFTGPTIASATASISAKTVALSASKVYDGSTALAGAVTVTTGVGNETLDISGATASDAHVLSSGKFINAVALTDGTGPNAGLASDYQLPTLSSVTAPVSITPASLALSLSNSAITKTYDGTTNAPLGFIPTYSVTGLVSGDTAASFSVGAVLYNDPNVASATTLQATGLALSGITGGNASVAGDYTLSNTSSSVAATITRAPLAVRANDDARFVTLADTVNFNGVGFTGLVNGETAATAVGSGTYTVTRPNTGTDVSAGVYSGALVPGALTSNNYNLSYVNGNYTIVPAGQLLVRVTNNTNAYGSTAAYAGNAGSLTAQYLDGGNVIQTLAAPTVNNTNYAYDDGAGNLFNFNITPFTTGATPVPVTNSTAGKTPVGNWQMAATGLSGSTGNFSGNLTVVGVQTVTPKSVAISTGGVSKAYDGNVSMTSLTVGLTGLVAPDVVTVAGDGAFSSKDASTNLGYTVSGLQLTGTDSANYVLSGGNAFSGSDGTITPKTVILSANKTYDGSTSLSGAVTLNTGISGESLSYTGASASDSHVATAGKFITAITLADGTGGLATNYVLPTLTAGNAPVTITAKALTSTAAITGTLSKTYDGTANATGATVSGSVLGAVSGDTLTLNSSGVALAYNSARVAAATHITATGNAALSIASATAGSVASDYSFTAPGITDVVASIAAKALTSTFTNTGVTKVYDGSTAAPVGFIPDFGFSGLVAGDTNASLGNAAVAYNNAHVADATTLTVSGLTINTITGSHGSVASDYVLDANSKSVAASISTRALTSAASIGGTLTKTYDGNTSASGAVVSGTVSGAIAGDTLALNTSAQTLTYNDAHVANATQITASGTSTLTISATGSGSVASDYSFSAPSIAAATASISARALTSNASIGGTLTKTYDGTSTATGATVSGSVSGAIAGDTLALDTSALTLSYNSVRVLAANSIVSSGTSSFSIGSTGSNSLASDYSFSGPTIAGVAGSISTRALTSAASIGGTLTKTYDGNTSASGAVVSGTVSGAIAGDTLALNTSGQTLAYNDAHVLAANAILASGTSTFAISATGSGSEASDYSFSPPSIAPATASISAATLTSTLTNTSVTKVYDSTDAAPAGFTPTYAITGFITGDAAATLTNSAIAFDSAHAASASKLTVSGLAVAGITGTNNSLTTDYVLDATSKEVAASITPKTVALSASKTYDASADLMGAVTLATGISGETLQVAAATANSRNVGNGNFISAITLADGSGPGLVTDYQLPVLNSANAPVTINPLGLNLAGATGVSKTYDASTDLPSGVQGYAALAGVIPGVLAGDSVSLSGAPQFSSANAGSVQIVSGSLVLSGPQSVNYNLQWSNSDATIHKANLTVRVNNDAKLFSQSDSPNYNGAVYDGWVGGESAAVLGGALNITRSNAGVEAAGVYTGVLTGAGLTATNYTLRFVNGNYTIVPASQLLVRVTPLSSAYGNAPAYTVASAAYLASDTTTINTLPVTSNGNNSFTIDGTTVQVSPSGAVTSTSGNVAAGSYQLGGVVASGNSANFSNNLVVTGALQVQQKGISSNATAPVSKVYDGTTSTGSAAVGLTGITSGDAVTASGAGDFSGRNVGTGLGYAIRGITLSGADANNYFVSGGSNVSGSNGQITPRTLLVVFAGDNKVYDGNTSATVTTTDDRITGDTVAVARSAVFVDKNVASAKTVNVTGVAISGADAGNYSVASTGSTTANITRLNSITWVGGGTGNWFDPRNWAGGAVPDLSNVANVIIPTGITVSFGTTVLAPAENAPVNIDSLGNQGSLAQAGGTLNVGSGGVRLAGLTQSGGDFTSLGPVVLGSFDQTGGNTRTGTGVDFTVDNRFNQTGNGTLTVGGKTTTPNTTGGTGGPPPVNPPVVAVPSLPNAGSGPPQLAIDVSTSGLEGSDGVTSSLGGANSPGVQVEMQRPGTLEDLGLATISLPKGTATAGVGFSFAVPRELLDSANGQPLTATLADGSPLPGWLRYDVETQRFVASAVPDGAFPVQLLVTVGQRRAILVISERSEN